MTAPALAGLVTLVVGPDAGPADLPHDLPVLAGAVAVDDLLLPTVRDHAPGLPVTVVGTGGAAQVAGPLALAARAGLVLAGCAPPSATPTTRPATYAASSPPSTPCATTARSPPTSP
ncbi:hypothetical protein [Nocardioides zeae]